MLHNFAFKKRLHHLCAAAIAIFSYLLSGDECKAVIKTLESKSPAITPSNGQHQTVGMFCQMSRKLHKITDHRTYSSAMYFLPAGSILLFQRFLPYDSKDIICDHCQLQHQFVALKLSRWESFNIHVRLDFTVILPISVNGSFRDLINCAYSDSFLFVIRKGICNIPEGLSDINSFPITWMLDILAAFPDGSLPFFFTFLSALCAFHAACRHLPAGCLCAENPRSCQNADGVFRRKESHRRCLMRICSSQGHPSFHGQPHTGVFPDRAYQYR